MNSKTFKSEVWAPDPIEGYVQGTIIDIKADGFLIKVDFQKTISTGFDHVFPVEELERDVDDNCALMHLNNATLLNNIKIRYKKDVIYTYVANILIAINPYGDIPGLYSKETINKYKGKSIGTLPPHVFAIADQAFRNMKIEKNHQSIVVSGESGAGKTETTKYILQYLTECYGAHAGPIEQRIVESNPLLEAFGNAKTVRNNNSSRSGKFIEIHFNQQLQIVGANVSHYLLEKSRICRQGPGERNYHIFYRICAGMSADERQKLGIGPPDQFNYLKNGTTQYFCSKTEASKLGRDQTTNEFLKKGCLNDIQLNDVIDYKKTCTAMKDMGLTNEEIWDVFSIVAGLLHLGNIEFTDSSGNQGGCEISRQGQAALQQASKLLGFDSSMLADSLCNRYTQAASKGAQNSAIQIALNTADAQNAKDALAKAIYVRLFEEIVNFVNKALPFSTSANFIGILDIAGFEYFERNDFEQFCINYCNEKLQQFFNKRILKDEQNLYEKEGLGLNKIQFIDNQDCIDIIEQKSTGIIDILDEESKLPKPSSENFTNCIFTKNPKNFRLQLPRKSKLKVHREIRDNEGFLIRHYAGAVCYHTEAFIDKNNDALHDSLKTLLESSKIKLMQMMFHKEETNSTSLISTNSRRPNAGKLTFISVASKFRSHLGVLLEKLQNSGSNFIRCVKPNVSMVPKLFEGGGILSQLECSGTTTVLDLMQQGFPSRIKFTDLYTIYNNVLPPNLAKLDPKLFCKLLFKAVGLNESDYRFGMTKVFFRPGKMAAFDQLVRSDPAQIQQMVAKVKSWLIKYRWRKAQYGVWEVIKLKNKIKWRRQQIIKIQKTMRGWIMFKKYGLKIKGLVELRTLNNMLDTISSVNSKLKNGNSKGIEMINKNKKKFQALESQIKSLSIKENRKIHSLVDQLRKELEIDINMLRKELEKEKVNQEKERLRQIQEQMELEKKRAEEERLKLLQEEENKRQKIDMEKNRKIEEDKLKTIQLQQTNKTVKSSEKVEHEKMEKFIEDISKEQERRDHELALRVSQGDITSLEDGLGSVSSFVKKAPGSIPINTQNVTEFQYDELRRIINESSDVKLIEACQVEFHRRINAYNEWKKKKSSNQVTANQHVSPVVAINTPTTSPTSIQNASPVKMGKHARQRFFRLPFKRSNGKSSNGIWMGHYDGEYIARQIEIHDERIRILLLAGVDDIGMCELALSNTGLTTKKGAEITEEEFEEVWRQYGGRDLIRHRANNITSKYLREKFLS